MTKLDDLRLLHDQMKSLHMMYYDLLSGMSGAIKKEYSPETLADIGFFCREGEILLDDWRKNAKAFKELISRKLSRTILQDPKNLDPETATIWYMGSTPQRRRTSVYSPNCQSRVLRSMIYF